MVFAAPLFLMSSTSGLRGVYLANKQAFINVGFGMSIGYLAVGLMSKMAELDDVKGKLAVAAAEAGAVRALLSSDDAWLREFRRATGATASDEALRGALVGGGLEAALRAERHRAREAAEAASGTSLLRMLVGGVAAVRSGSAREAGAPQAAGVAAGVAAQNEAGGPGGGRNSSSSSSGSIGKGAAGGEGAVRVAAGKAAGAALVVPAVAALPPPPPPLPGPKGIM